MDASIRPKELLIPPLMSQSFSQAATLIKISSSDNFSLIASCVNSDTNVTNNSDLNAAASLSDDSGIPQTTNSSISSGDSYNLEMCKYGTELNESDAEVSQFDSLENCSERGMSTENFNTLKKGPLAPIDPPPEFQDSPKSTLRRSLSQSIYNSLRRSASSNSSFLFIKDRLQESTPSALEVVNVKKDSLRSTPFKKSPAANKDNYANAKHLFASDSILNTNMEIVYNEEEAMKYNLNKSTENINSSLSDKLKNVNGMKFNKCPYYEDHTRYFKAIPSEQDILNNSIQCGSIVHEIYNSSKINGQQKETTLIRKFIRSPLTQSYHCHHYQACGNRPHSRNSLCSRLSSSHNSLNFSSANKPDDSIFITQAMSHDTLLHREITDFYTVPIDSDIYAFPIDMIESEKVEKLKYKTNTAKLKFSKQPQNVSEVRIKKKKNMDSISMENYDECKQISQNPRCDMSLKSPVSLCTANEYESNNDNFLTNNMQLSLEEVKEYYQSLFSEEENTPFPQRYESQQNLQKSQEAFWTSNSIRLKNGGKKTSSYLNSQKNSIKNFKNITEPITPKNEVALAEPAKLKNHPKLPNSKTTERAGKKSNEIGRQTPNFSERSTKKSVYINGKRSQFTLNLKQKFCSIFRFRRPQNNDTDPVFSIAENHNSFGIVDRQKKFQTRALPPVPKKTGVCETDGKHKDETKKVHFASSIEKVKDYGWYWGPLSSEAAEKVLSNEPDGSFIVRDSSDDHYIFSLSFKLNNCVRHVRIEQDQGTFSFGSYAKFKSQTITEFIEKAVEHSRSGRYLFFLHRRPEHGPMRVQLTNPVSRFKHVQSLQHMCRFVILKTVIRTDLIQNLPLPRRLLDYLNYKHCFSEDIENDNCHSQI